MKFFLLFFSRRAVEKTSDWWTVFLPFILASTIWFGLFDKISFFVLNTNRLVKFLEFNLLIFFYILGLCGAAMVFEKDKRKVLQIPLYFLPYIFLPLYTRILDFFAMPVFWAFEICFLHSMIISLSEYGLYFTIFRVVGNLSATLVVRDWL